VPLNLLRSRFLSDFASAFVAALVLALTSCSAQKSQPGDKLNLDGVVTVNGRPLKSGTITFVCENHDIRSTEVSNGKFSIDGITPGKVRISIGPAAGSGSKSDKSLKAAAGKTQPPDPAIDFANLKEKEDTIATGQLRIEVRFP
jgi:hypothetical protein